MGDVSLNPQINAEPLSKVDQFLDLMSDGWTNERHSLYISSMEASFMEQLYGNEHHGQGGSNGFRVHRDGVYDNLRSERNDAHAHDGGMSCFPENSWIMHFRPCDACVNPKNDGVGFSVDDDESGTHMVRQRVRVHGREVKSCVEVSDQNFPDEDVEVDAEPCKRRRPTNSTKAPNDQTT